MSILVHPKQMKGWRLHHQYTKEFLSTALKKMKKINVQPQKKISGAAMPK
jgi:hypothetical protein